MNITQLANFTFHRNSSLLHFYSVACSVDLFPELMFLLTFRTSSETEIDAISVRVTCLTHLDTAWDGAEFGTTLNKYIHERFPGTEIHILTNLIK